MKIVKVGFLIFLALLLAYLQVFCDPNTAYAVGHHSITCIVAISIISYFIGWLLSKPKFQYSSMKSSQKCGYEYERRVAKALSLKGFRHIMVTPGSGDFGADIIATKGFEKYSIQCKYYAGTVGVSAVQEALSGMSYYKCKRAMVVTNSTFTQAAKKLAKTANVTLLEHFNPKWTDWIDRIESYDAIIN